jgi:ribonuclease HI
MEIEKLFCDGGCIDRNPSESGGTWAYRRVRTVGGVDTVVFEDSAVVTPLNAGMPKVTNNLTEMLAALRGLSCLPRDWAGDLCSDSQITLGRLFWGWKWTGIPSWMHQEYQKQRSRFTDWSMITPVLLAGHPTKAQLTAGIGHHGHPVSIHNVACDRMCNERAAEFKGTEAWITRTATK